MEPAQDGYLELLHTVQEIISNTQTRINQTINQEKIAMCWKIGEMIHLHLLSNNRAQYGSKIFQQLQEDTQINIDRLYQMRNFYKEYPSKPPLDNNLTWSHYRQLIAVKDATQRQYFEDLSVAKKLPAAQLQTTIAKSKLPPEPEKVKTKIAFTRGKLFQYKLVILEESPQEKHVDCGFNIFSQVTTNINAPAIVVSKQSGGSFLFNLVSGQNKTTYTYKAFLTKIVDGDTLRVTLDLGFNIKHREILRLKAINAPEIKTAAGQKSAAALAEILKDVEYLVIKTNKVDIYGRYVADVFFKTGETDLHQIAQTGTYLNQLLVDQGLAVIY